MSSRNEDPAQLTLGRALALGALHGPAELLPVSSSGHVAVVPWLLGWGWERLDGELRKALEVALHAGTAGALLIALRSEVAQGVREVDAGGLVFATLTVAPAAIAGLALERPIERRLGTPATVAAGLAGGAVAIALADRSAQARTARDATLADALWLGLAQACALAPGVSRNGATLAAARMRRFTRADASRLSRHAALPVIAGATALKGLRLARRGLPPRAAAALVAGAAASFGSTLSSTWLIAQVERDRSLLPYAAYRLALAGAVATRLRSARRR